MKPRRGPHRLPRQRGTTLVELMVGMAIGLFLLTVMGAVYLGSKTTFNSQDALSTLQENGRFAVDTLSADLRMGGFRGCAGQAGGQNSVTNTLVTPTALPYDFGRGVAASHYTGSAWAPALDASISALSPSTAGDVFTVYRSYGTSWALTGEMAAADSDLQVGTTTQITSGDILVVADCAGVAVFQATNTNPGGTGVIQHHAAATGFTPGVSTDSLGRAYLQDASVYRLQAVTYYIAPSVRQPGLTALWSTVTPNYGTGAATNELVTGAEKMAVTLGLDTDADQAADRFVTPDAVTDWTQVVSVRVELLLGGTDTSTTTVPQSYVFNGVSTTPTDHRLRTVVSLVASLRNTAP